MCGIIGINCNSNLKNNLDKSLIKLGHRGPDSSGFFISPGNDTLIGHTRLAILDLSANGHQPMLDTKNIYAKEVILGEHLRLGSLRIFKKIC